MKLPLYSHKSTIYQHKSSTYSHSLSNIFVWYIFFISSYVYVENTVKYRTYTFIILLYIVIRVYFYYIIIYCNKYKDTT